MAYTVINDQMFIAAYSGALSGMGVSGRMLQDENASDYAPQVDAANAFAQEFDTLWNNATAVGLLEVLLAHEACESLWQNRNPQLEDDTLFPAKYETPCRVVIALLSRSSLLFASQSYTNPLASVVPGNWVQLYAPDFLNATPFTYPTSTPDTGHVVDGVNIWGRNTTAGTIAFNPSPGVGLQMIQTSGTGALFSGTPMIYIDFTDMAAIGVGNGPFRITVQYELVNGFTGVQFTNEIGMGISVQTGNFPVFQACRVFKDATPISTFGSYNVNLIDVYTTNREPNGAKNLAQMTFWPPMSAEFAFSQFGGRAVVAPQGKIFHYTSGPGGVNGFVMNRAGTPNTNGYRVVLGINTGNGGGTLGTVRFRRLIVEQWVPSY